MPEKMPKHTPGPWEVGEWIRSGGGAVYRQIKTEGRRLASVSVFAYKPDGKTGGREYTDRFGTQRHARVISEAEANANAALIAAAPTQQTRIEELEEALRGLMETQRLVTLNYCTRANSENWAMAKSAARAILAKSQVKP